MSRKNRPNGKHCVNCGKPLTGRQSLYDSIECKNEYRSVKAKEADNEHLRTKGEPKGADSEIAEWKGKAEGAAIALRQVAQERDRLIEERDKAQTRATQLERENGALQAKIEMLEQRQTPKTWRDRLFRR